MKNRALKMIFIVIIFASLTVCIFHSIGQNENNAAKNKNYVAEFNKRQKEYIEKNQVAGIYVDEELSYLAVENEDCFLKDYTEKLLSPSGLSVDITTNRDESDCDLYVVTKEIRDKSNDINFTAPLFQVEGKLYIKDGYDKKPKLSGAAMEDRLSEKELDRIKYDGVEVDWTLFKTAEEIVEYAEKNDIDCILGDKSAVVHALGPGGKYIGVKDGLYRYNVCIIADKKNDNLTDIINQCVHSMNRKLLSYQMSEKWLNGDGPLYMENDYGDVYALILIVFVAVFIAFFVYYQSNKNLYWELSDRMNKLMESKKELQTTFSNIGYCLAELSLEGNIIDINSAFYDFVEKDVANRKIWNVIGLNDEDRAVLENEILNIGRKEKIRSMEVKAGSKTLMIDVYPIDNALGAVDKLLFMAMDVTNERMAERQMLQDNKMIAVGQLAAGVAHEIRNPLGIIRNYCYVLKNMSDKNLKEKAISQIEKAVDTSGAIIDSLLNFSKVSSKEEKLIDVEAHIKSLILLNNSTLKAKHINVELICSEIIETSLIVESLDMILINLISNATDAMETNGKLTIEINKLQNSFEVKVTDTGTGISENELEEIFNPFFTTKGDCGGTGLGLYIVYNEISKMNGTIKVNSKVGEGTEFGITLPMKGKNEVEKENYNG